MQVKSTPCTRMYGTCAAMGDQSVPWYLSTSAKVHECDAYNMQLYCRQ
jgi:hypothetical protein